MADDAAEDDAIKVDSVRMNIDLRKELQKQGATYQSDVIEPAAKVHKRNLGSLKDQMRNGVHPAVPHVTTGSHWSLAEEEVILAEWESEKSQWTRMYDRDRYLGLWKICLQFANCTPWDIVGFKNKLKFELDLRGNSEEEDEDGGNHNWSSKFIHNLTFLVTHPAWSCNSMSRATALGTAIQYAVIMRTNDQRAWDLSSLRGPFFEQFHTLCQQRCPCSIADIHTQVRLSMKQSGVDFPALSGVFYALEQLIKVPADPFVPSDDDDGTYYATSRDLANLIKALDRVVDEDTRINLYMPTELISASAKAARGGRGPPAMRDLDRYHELALLEEKGARP